MTINNLVDCIEGLEDLLKYVDLSEHYLNGIDSPNPYTEEDKVKDIIKYLKTIKEVKRIENK